jgi:hydroxymethylpyrimidine/phosphomethylpyrimidine kinase
MLMVFLKGALYYMSETTYKASGLAVGGFDPTGGAGVLLDVKAMESIGVYGTAVVAVSTIQSGSGFVSARPENRTVVGATLEMVLGSLDIGAVKTGALGSLELVETVAFFAGRSSFPPLVVDPVTKSTTGGVLLHDDAVSSLRDQLLPRAALVTPNLFEAGILTGMEVKDTEGMIQAARRLVDLGAGAALVKGGHLAGDVLTDVLVVGSNDPRRFESERLGDGQIRGTGCALASLIAGYLARGSGLEDAVVKGRQSLGRAIAGAVQLGPGPRVLCFNDAPGPLSPAQ